jgi:hypothetical protein
MTLEQTNVVDAVGIESASGDLVMTLTDAWSWSESEEAEHLLLLQDKLNHYIAAIESGEIYESYAQQIGRALRVGQRTRVEVALLNPPSAKAREFFRTVKTVLLGIGVEFRVVEGRAKVVAS